MTFRYRNASFAVMFENVTPEKAIAFTKYNVILTALWPLAPTATKYEKIRYATLRAFFIINAIALLLPLLNATRIHKENPAEVTRAGMMSVVTLGVLIRTFFGVYHYDRFQRVLEEMKSFLKNAKPYERSVIQKYIDNYGAFYWVAAVWIYLTVLLIGIGFLLSSDLLPSNAAYPFRVDYQPVWTIIFVNHGIVGFQCASHLNLNIQTALLTFFTAARFEILMIKMRDVNDTALLAMYMKQYQDLKRFAREVIITIEPNCVITVAGCFFSSIFSAISLIGNLPNSIRMQYGAHAISGLLETYMCALPCEYLMNMSGNVMSGLYESDWYNRARGLQACILIGLAPQAPVIVKIPCLISSLTLNYFSAFVSNVFSMFTVLRTVLMEDD